MNKSPAVEYIENKVMEESGLNILSSVPYLQIVTETIFGTKDFKMGVIPHKSVVYVQPLNISKETFEKGKEIAKAKKLNDFFRKSLNLDYQLKFVLRLPKNSNVQSLY